MESISEMKSDNIWKYLPGCHSTVKAWGGGRREGSFLAIKSQSHWVSKSGSVIAVVVPKPGEKSWPVAADIENRKYGCWRQTGQSDYDVQLQGSWLYLTLSFPFRLWDFELVCISHHRDRHPDSSCNQWDNLIYVMSETVVDMGSHDTWDQYLTHFQTLCLTVSAAVCCHP